MTATLGEGFKAKSRSDDFIDNLRADITDAVMAEVRKALMANQAPPPVVHVAAPPAPNVTVNAPVEMPEHEAITVEVEMPGIDRLVTVLNDLKGLLSASVTRVIERDTDDLITRVVETRG